MNCLLVFPA